MKNMWKRGAALCLVLVLALALTACGGGIDASALVQGNLDEIYFGKADADYLKSVDTTAEEAYQTYLDGLDMEADIFMHYFDIEDTGDEMRAKIVDLYKEIYAQAKYTVAAASKMDSETYAVKVTVEPLDIFDLMVDRVNEMTDEEFAAFEANWDQSILDLCYELLPEMGYLEEQSVVIQVVLEDDYWVMSDDFYNLDEIVIYYP